MNRVDIIIKNFISFQNNDLRHAYTCNCSHIHSIDSINTNCIHEVDLSNVETYNDGIVSMICRFGESGCGYKSPLIDVDWIYPEDIRDMREQKINELLNEQLVERLDTE